MPYRRIVAYKKVGYGRRKRRGRMRRRFKRSKRTGRFIR